MAHTLINSKSRVIWDSGSVAGGAAFDSGVLDLSELESLLIVTFNGDAGTRILQLTGYLEDGTTVVYGPSTLRTVPVGPTTTDVVAVGPGVVVTGVNAIAGWSVLPCRAKFGVTATGTGACRVTIYGR